MRKKTTAGERIVWKRVKAALNRPAMTIEQFRTEAVYAIPREEAKGIDRAIRAAVNAALDRERTISVKLRCDAFARGWNEAVAVRTATASEPHAKVTRTKKPAKKKGGKR